MAFPPRGILSLALFCAIAPAAIFAQATVPIAAALPADAELKYTVFVTRHGVRSPTGKSSQYDQYSRAPWPTWDVPPGFLTKHGFALMQTFGSYDRLLLQSEGLLTSGGCSAAGAVTIYADSDERTRETGRALAAGLFPGCEVAISGRAEGEGDPLFHTPASAIQPAEAALAAAAVAGRIGDNPAGLVDAYRPELTALDQILATCGTPATPTHTRTPVLSIPAAILAGSGDHAAEMRGPLNTAATLTENLLLEYAEGMDLANVGWGCVDGAKLRSLIDLHTAASDLAQRTRPVATIQASTLLDTIRRSMEQAATGKPGRNLPGKPADQALFLVGHDTNLSNLAGMLDLNWLADGRRDDTPPGSTLGFELWRSRKTGELRVRLYFMAQTLEQMRNGVSAGAGSPERVPVFIPGCSGVDLSCTWEGFSHTVLGTLGETLSQR